jgi:hypothetical protein
MLLEPMGEGDTNLEVFNIRYMHESLILYLKFTITLLIVSVKSVT